MPSSIDAVPMILITRPAEDAVPLVDDLRAAGLDGLIEPMLRIEPVPDAAVDLSGCRAILFTSANGVRAFAALSPRRDLPVLTVGAVSAKAARAVGFEDVEAAGGDVDLLAMKVRARFEPGSAPLFHAAGSVTAGDLKAGLQADGYTVRRVSLYNAEAASGLSEACRTALDTGRIAGVTFFSPRTAATFVRLLRKEGRAFRARTVWALCLSTAVADAVGAVTWAGTRVADVPDTSAMVACARQLFRNNMAENRTNDMGEAQTVPTRTCGMTDDKKANETRAPEETESEADAFSKSADALGDLNTDAVINAFGGIRPMASKLGIAVSTVQGWKTRGRIPENRWRDVIAAAAVHDVDLGVALPDSGTAEETPEATESDAGPPPATTPAPATSGGGGLALLIGLVALAAVVTRPVWGPYVDPHLPRFAPAPAGTPGADPALSAVLERDLKALRARLAAMPGDLDARLAPLEQGLATMQETAATLRETGAAAQAVLAETKAALQVAAERDEVTRARLVERMGVLDGLVRRISGEAERATSRLAGIEARIADQDAAIAALEARPAVRGATQAGIALAIGDIETALSAGRPFNSALARIMRLVDDGNPVARAAAALRDHAAAGVPTRAALITGFRRDAPAIQAELGRDGGNVVETLLDGARSLISVRRKGEAPDAPPVSRAEAALARGDLAGAVTALAPEAGGSETLRVWLAAADSRLAAEAALANLRAAAAESLTGGATSRKGPS